MSPSRLFDPQAEQLTLASPTSAASPVSVPFASC
uniref:Uncharacterized protein n=1 Tax=Arundo donax TaxID=35708 RepID=A0A0A8ZET4_ARUDO